MPRRNHLMLAAADPLSDAQAQLQTLSAYFIALGSGPGPTAAQEAAAQQAIVALQNDLNLIGPANLSPAPAPATPATNPPTNTKVWVSGAAATAIAGGAAVVGGAVGYAIRGAMKGKRR